MGQPFIQNSFHAGEWAPALNARVDLAKYHSAAELLENFFVDYRGGASSRPGTKYIIRCMGDTEPTRLIPFQASFNLGYILQFFNGGVMPVRDGAPVLEPTIAITGATQANPCVVSVVNTYAVGERVFITGVGGMTQLNGKYYRISARTGGTITLHDLFDQPVNSTAYGAYTAGGTTARVYYFATPYTSAQLADIKFTQDVDQMILCHPTVAPQLLVYASATSWTMSPISFGTNISPPTGLAAVTTLAAGTVNHAYLVTAVDGSGQESVPSSVVTLNNIQDLRTTPGTIAITWAPVADAAFYNIYKASVGYTYVVPAGASFGYVGNATVGTFLDSNISADFSQTPPVAQNPFFGSGVVSYTVTVNGAYTSVPTVTVAPSSGGISSATANAELWVTGTPTVGAGGAGYAVNDTIALGNGVIVVVNTVAAGVITAFKAISVAPGAHGAITAGATPTNPVAQVSTSGGGTGATINLVWGVGRVIPVSPGAGYGAAPAVTFSSGAAAATAVLGPSTDLNPEVPGFFQQRLVLGALAGAPQSFFMSQSGAPFNFNITNPVQADNAISGALVSGQLNTIQSMVAMPAGLLVLTDRAVWLISGGGGAVASDAVTPSNISANPHSYIGASGVPPIVSNFDVLYVQAKGSVIRDVAYNIYSNVFTGTDISVLSSHLFYGYEILEWAWAEEPFKLVWAIRDDGTALSLTYMKEQELIGWSHSTTLGSFLSVATTIEATDFGNTDAVYFIIERTIEASTVQYIERLAERSFPNGAEDAWCVDSGLQYDGVPATSFSGAEHLGGQTVTGLADGAVITPFVMSLAGTFTLATPASKVTVGLAFTPKLKTLALDVNAGDGTVQGREKKISQVTVRVEDTLGLQIGTDFGSPMVDMSDLELGSVGSSTNEVVTNLVTGDAQQIIDPAWTTQGQYCIQQSNPWPATILGVIPEVTIGDNTK